MTEADPSTRHLHRDYLTAYCGLDASHILMTYAPEEADCAACIAAGEAHRQELAEAEVDQLSG